MILGSCLSLALLAASPSVAAPAPKDDVVKAARDAFETGQKLYRQKKYAEAVVKFEAAYAAKPHPSVLFNIARCREALLDVPRALRAYRDYLRLSPGVSDRQQVQDAIANLERRLREAGLQQLLVFAEPPSARVAVDGRDLGASPASVELAQGPHRVVVSAPGFATVERDFTMQLLRGAELTVTLEPQPAPTASLPPDAPVAAASPTGSLPASVLAVPAPPPPPLVEAHRAPVGTIVAGGVAVAGLGTAVAFGLLANATAADLRATGGDRARVDTLVSTATSHATVSNVSYGVAATAAITAGVLLLLGL